MVIRTWVGILQMKVSIIIGINNYTKMFLLLDLHIYIVFPTTQKIPTP